MERFFRYNPMYDEKLPLVKMRKKQGKNKNFHISNSTYQIYTKFTSRYVFDDGKYGEIT